MTDHDAGKPEPGPDASVDDVEADETKELIADKAESVRSKGSEVGSQVVDVATNDQGSVRAVVPAVALALVAVIGGVIIWRRRG
jgi:hypothetical protein